MRPLLLAILISGLNLVAGSFTEVGYSLTGPSMSPSPSCESTLTVGAFSKTLNIGQCSPSGFYESEHSHARITASAEPLLASLDAEPGSLYYPSLGLQPIEIITSGRAEFTGSLEAVGGSGLAWVELEITSYGMAPVFGSGFAVPDLGVSVGLGCCVTYYPVTFPISFNQPTNYFLGVDLASQPGDWFTSASISIVTYRVVDANGNDNGGLTWSTSPVEAIHQPEPGTIQLLGVAFGVILARRVTGRSSHCRRLWLRQKSASAR